VLRDETQLFELLDGLENSKKNLLTYYFDKHGARGTVEGVGAGNYSASTVQAQDGAGTDDEKVIKELLRLDAKISTPIKSVIP
jgi:CLIP-associating protein 1/2